VTRRFWTLDSIARHAAVLAVASLASCTSVQSDDHDRNGLDLLGMRTPSGPLLAADVAPERPSMREYRITSGRAAGREILQAVKRTAEHGAEWSFNDDGTRVEYWDADEAGNLVMPVLIDYEDRTITVFDPPLVLVYDRMRPGEPRHQEVTMEILDSRQPDVVIRTGTAQRVMEYVDDQIVRTPAGEFRTHRLAIRFEADFGDTVVERTSTLYIAPGIGVIAEDASETAHLPRLDPRSQRQTVVLSRYQPARQSEDARSGRPNPQQHDSE